MPQCPLERTAQEMIDDPIVVGGITLDVFMESYFVAGLWSSTDHNEKDMDDKYTLEDLCPETIREAIEYCDDFRKANAEDLKGWTDDQAGFDFWMTRNGHGVGFWDRGRGKVGDRLSEAAKVYGGAYLYADDDGKVYSA